MTLDTDDPNRRSRRIILLGGGLALVVVYAVGAVMRVPYVEDDLNTRVTDDATATTAMNAATTVAPKTAAPASTTSPATTSPATIRSTTTSPATTSPTTIRSTTTSTATTAVQFGAQLVDGRFVLTGTVSSDLERLALVDRAAGAVHPANVSNQLAVDPSAVTVPADRFTAFLDVLVLMPLNLVAADLVWNGVAVSVRGTYADDAFRDSFGAAAKRVGVAAAVTERLPASSTQAAALEAELNALVAAEPILFDKGSTNISAFSVATVQKVAGMAKRHAGVTIEVQGHTDSEGDPGRNLALSEQRAGSVRDALGALGVPVADLTAKGFGITQLITDANGNEIPDKSRRVVFGVTVV